MRLKKRYLCTALSLAFTQQAVAAQESDTLTVWSSPVSSTTTTVLDQPTMKALDKQNVAQALSVVPGVVLQKSGSRNEEQVKVRGLIVVRCRSISTVCPFMFPMTATSIWRGF